MADAPDRGGVASQRGRALLRPFLMLLVPLVVVGLGGYTYLKELRYVSTDNAYVKANLVTVSPTIDGRVVAVLVADNQQVSAGQLLFRLDPRPHALAIARADARAAAIVNELASMKAEYAQVQAELADAGQRVRFLTRRKKRESELATRGMTTASKIDEVEYEVSEGVQRVRALEQRARQVLAALGGSVDLDVRQHPRYLENQAARNEAKLALEYTEVRSSTEGKVSRMRLQAGEWVESGEAVFTVVQASPLWIEANLKETQMTHVEVGQRVAVVADAYPERRWQGRVSSISAAAGSEFLVLPAQNATGNWVKVVQRVPVRIEVEGVASNSASAGSAQSPMWPLRAGLTVTARIDTETEHELLSLMREATAAWRAE